VSASDGRFHAWAAGLTFGIHALVVVALLVMGHLDASSARRRPLDEPVAIEAGLAIKSKSTGGKKSRLPQKELAPMVKPPEAEGVARDPDAVPEPETDKPKDQTPPPPDKVDPKSVFDKYRNMEAGDTQTGDQKDDQNQQGSADGSEFGTLERAKGDPYVGELIGRMTVDFTVPSVVSEDGLLTWGCVMLDDSGRITDRKIDPDHKSRSHAFNSAVWERLKQATDMEAPVPDHLKSMLVGKFVCATYRT
jgi:hypothetical protein